MKAAVIGCTGRGNFGHGLDVVWNDVPDVVTVAVADSDPKGLAGAVKRIGGKVKGYADYQRMLEIEKPDVVSIAPRWLDQHAAMTISAAESGVRGIYLEKPMCQDLVQADAMITACEKNGVKLGIAYQTRYSPKLPVIDKLIDEGKIGEILELRGRGKEDRRGGGEDLWVLGSHVMNLMTYFGGKPSWCSASVLASKKPVAKNHVSDGPEGIGPLAGDSIRATYGMAGNITGYFASHRNMGGSPTRFGLMIHGSEGLVWISHGFLPDVHWLPDSSWTPGRTGKEWIPISSNGPGKPESIAVPNDLHAGNVAACKDLTGSIQKDVQPETSIFEAATSTEMIAGVFESHRLGKPVNLPLKTRANPLSLL